MSTILRLDRLELGELIEITEFPKCYKVYLRCPKCGKKGIAFISKTSETTSLRIHHKDDSCLMMKSSSRWGREIERILSLLRA